MTPSILPGPSSKICHSQANKDPKQKNPNLTHIICKPQMFKEARKDFTLQNEEYLRGLNNGGVGAYLGANTNGDRCQRMSCEYASGIYVCNDNDRAINVPFDTLADYAQAVVDDPREECNWHEEHYQGGTDGEDVTWGQAFDANGWSVGDFVLSFSSMMLLHVCLGSRLMLTLRLTPGTSLLVSGILITSARDRSAPARRIRKGRCVVVLLLLLAEISCCSRLPMKQRREVLDLICL